MDAKNLAYFIIFLGRKKRIRPEAEESPIELIRVSFYLCYLAISFKNEPLEIWDLKSMRLLRRMSRKCPVIVDMASLYSDCISNHF